MPSVARLDADTLTDVAQVTAAHYGQSHGGLPALAVTGGLVTAAWYPGSGHEHVQEISPDPDGLFVIGPHILPWTLPQEQAPGYDARAVSAAGPVRQWYHRTGSGPSTPPWPRSRCPRSAPPSSRCPRTHRPSSAPTAPRTWCGWSPPPTP